MILLLGWFPCAGSAEPWPGVLLQPPPSTRGLTISASEDVPHHPSLPHGDRTGLFTFPLRYKELTGMESVLCRNISAVFWALKLHNIKNIQQYNILFAFSKASVLVWNIISHKYSSKNPRVFNRMEFPYDLISKVFQVLKSGETEKSFLFPFPAFPLLLIPFLIFPFSFYFDFLSFYRNSLPKSQRVLERLLWPKFPFWLGQEVLCWRWTACCKVMQERWEQE